MTYCRDCQCIEGPIYRINESSLQGLQVMALDGLIVCARCEGEIENISESAGEDR